MMEAPAETGVAMKILPMKTPKWRRGVAGPQGQRWVARNLSAGKWRVFRPPHIGTGGGLGFQNQRPSEPEKVLQPLQRVAGKMVIIRKARSWILKATPAENPGGVGEWGAGGRQGERSRGPPPAGAPHLPGTRRGNRAAGRQEASLPPNWVAGEDPGATEQEAEEQPEQVGLH